MIRVVRVLLTALLLVVATVATDAHAQPAEQRARDLFNAGVQAYNSGKFMVAAQAFISAHKLMDKPELLFSTAQAFRRQFDSENAGPPLRMAVKYYDKYLSVVKEGGRRLEAARALSELKPYLKQFGGGGDDAMVFPTHVSVTSPVKGAVVSIDGGPLQAVPYNGQIKPGAHKAVVRASGYQPGERDFVAKEGDMVPLDVPLRGKPPLLDVVGASGADLTVDGKLVGTMPLARPLELGVGTHFVAVTENGHKPYAAELSFDQGASTTLTLDLPTTNQRRWAVGVLTASGGAFATSVVLGVLAFQRQNKVQEIEDIQAAGNITEDQRLEHNDALDERDTLAGAAGLALTASMAIGITGLLLYVFDEPTVRPPAARASQPSEEPGEAPKEERPSDVEILGGAPTLGPGMLGLQLVGRF